MKKKNLARTATLEKVIEAVNGIKEDIRFIRTDNIDMEDHLSNKIGLMETRLRHQAEINQSEIMDKLEKMTGQHQEVYEKVEKLDKIHPKFSHAAI